MVINPFSLVVSVQAWQVMDWGREFETTMKPLLLPYALNIVYSTVCTLGSFQKAQ